MKKQFLPLLAATLSVIFNFHVSAAPMGTEARRTLNFDANWAFATGEQTGADQAGFADHGWRKLDVPHDWSIEGEPNEKAASGSGGGYMPSGVAWYRKHFTLPADAQGRRVCVEFDGVMANSDVWINGHHLGHRPNGYVAFQYDLTAHLNFGDAAENVLSVRADTTVQPASRWYTGGGIYRHVKLVITDPVHLQHWGTFVTTPTVLPEHAIVHVENTVQNDSNEERELSVVCEFFGPDGNPVQTIESEKHHVRPGESTTFHQIAFVKDAQLWSPDAPNQYDVVSRVRLGDRTLDDHRTTFGIRECHWDAATGFWINGKNLKLLGVCLHHDGGAVGAAVPLSIWERRLDALRAVGVNAIRTAHNPPSSEFLDLCDRRGFLVMHETFDCWTVAKPHAEHGYQLYFKEWWETDTRDAVLRDRNHPSVVIYSAGNEIHDIPDPQLAFKYFIPMRDLLHRVDPTRPVTMAILRPNIAKVYDNGFSELMDVVGQNYRPLEVIAAHQQKPTRKMIGTENGHEAAQWLAMRDNPFYSGQFLWAGIDYLGESVWPNVVSSFGLLDHTGAMTLRAYERQSWWGSEPMVYICRRVAADAAGPVDPGYEPTRRAVPTLYPDWNPRSAQPHDENVEIYSNCEDVELLLNGTSLGSKRLNADASPRNWKVAYQPGLLQAIGRNGGKIVASYDLRTAGKPAKLVLTTDRETLAQSWDEVAFVRATFVDENGVRCQAVTEPVAFAIQGPGTIVAVDSNDRQSHTRFQAAERKAAEGQALAIIRSTAESGKIVITATSGGFSGTAEITSAAK